MEITGEENKNVDHEILHGVTLSMILDTLIDEVGFEELSYMIDINCFSNNPSKQSSLKFLRKTEWARLQVQGIYVTHMLRKKKR
jgi:uncharacterized protein (DUF2132 family)